MFWHIGIVFYWLLIVPFYCCPLWLGLQSAIPPVFVAVPPFPSVCYRWSIVAALPPVFTLARVSNPVFCVFLLLWQCSSLCRECICQWWICSQQLGALQTSRSTKSVHAIICRRYLYLRITHDGLRSCASVLFPPYSSKLKNLTSWVPVLLLVGEVHSGHFPCDVLDGTYLPVGS